PGIATAVDSVPSDQRLRELLVLAGLDPSDDDLWRAVLAARPEDDQREHAAAARLARLLADQAAPLGLLSAPVRIVDELFGAAGWLSTSTAHLLYGLPPSRWSSTHLRDSAEAFRACSAWFPGGFISGEAAQTFRQELVATSARLHHTIPSVAERVSDLSGVPPEELSASLEASIQELQRTMGSGGSGHTIWVLSD
ncbi:hypothetical protein B7486_64935, partial [cyanobacterium TDX16]